MANQSSELSLRDPATGAVAVIDPGRGGIVTRFDIGARQVLFLDEATLADPTKNVRGGVPVLFPSPGKLAGDAWSYGGHQGSMKQHGFARNLAWRAVQPGPDTAVLTLAASDETRAQFPWDFTVEHAFTLRGRTLRLDQRITNHGGEPMPFGFGFHPYFFVPQAAKAATAIATRATQAFDNVTKQRIALHGPGIDLTKAEVDLHLVDHGGTASELATPAGAVAVRGSAEYTHWVVWTLAGRDFVCLEPWTCPADALNTGDRLIVVAPNATRALWLEIAA